MTEYPRNDCPRDLRDALEDRFEALLAETGLRYSSHLADAPGIKLGGYPGWSQEPCWPDCETCGGRMEHLLTVAEGEFDSESWRTWLPEEDRTTENTETRWLWESEAFNPTRLDTCGIAAPSGADALALVGWDGPANWDNDTAPFSAVVSDWEQRFGACVVAVGSDTLHLSVAAPPTSTEDALPVAAEHFAFCPDSIWQGPRLQTLAAYAERLIDVHCWEFWWD
ncbi:DUF4253 domain-containing protein [Streptomyces sp. NBC_01546]|uniref:DUF4253 domain-containing protein n=1 Tax=Streptomyces sp. NBC_01546 TaxID=2975872 RepID=UPI003863943C